ncbi:hypothetical protein QUF72_06580 [Desulfobacterales bacterium HSG2]|nr:hypothetical protein [Desulfobacterales bacterium HSG2]
MKTGDITLDLQVCRHSGKNIICDFLITSTTDTEPEGFMIHVRGECKSKIIYSGKEYYANLAKLGEKSHWKTGFMLIFQREPASVLRIFQ